MSRARAHTPHRPRIGWYMKDMDQNDDRISERVRQAGDKHCERERERAHNFD